VSELPRGWTSARLGEVVDDARPGFPSGRHNASGVGVPHLRPMNVSRDGRIDLETVKYVEDKAGARIQSGDVLFNNTNSPDLVGKTAFFDRAGDWAYSNHMTRLRSSGATDGRFLAVQLHWLWMTGFYKTILNNHVNQASVATKNLLANVSVLVPPLAEQRRIVAAIEEHISRLDAAERSLRDAASKVAALRAAILAGVTAGLESTRLGELVTELRYGTSVKCSYDAAGPPVLRIPNVQRGAVDLSDLKYATDAELDLSSFSVQRGDLLFVRTNGSRDLIGRTASADGAAGMAFASYLIRARPDPARLESRYAVIALSTPKVRAVIESKAATSAGQYNLNLAALRSLDISRAPGSVRTLD
jgi:type I restriction enzyme S subunit